VPTTRQRPTAVYRCGHRVDGTSKLGRSIRGTDLMMSPTYFAALSARSWTSNLKPLALLATSSRIQGFIGEQALLLRAMYGWLTP
jgi:hypothetical protein